MQLSHFLPHLRIQIQQLFSKVVIGYNPTRQVKAKLIGDKEKGKEDPTWAEICKAAWADGGGENNLMATAKFSTKGTDVSAGARPAPAMLPAPINLAANHV